MDKRFFRNIKDAKSAGLKIGVYVYSYNKDEESAKKTACEIKEILGEEYKNIPVAFDCEEINHDVFINNKKEENSLICRAFLEKIKSFGFKPVIYSYTAFINNFLDMSILSSYHLWVADYRDKKGETCPYKDKFSLWQFKGHEGRCPGVEGPCDLNISYFDLWQEINYKEKYESLLRDLKELTGKFS